SLPGRGFSLARWALSVGCGPPQPIHFRSPPPRQQREFCYATRYPMLSRLERISLHVCQHVESIFPDFRQICHGGRRPHLYSNARQTTPHFNSRNERYGIFRRDRADPSGLMLAARITFAHVSAYSATKLPNSADELANGSRPNRRAAP